jgi:hypothetical protein
MTKPEESVIRAAKRWRRTFTGEPFFTHDRELLEVVDRLLKSERPKKRKVKRG